MRKTIVTIIMLGLIALGGWWIARRALRPVERMARRADEIGLDDFGRQGRGGLEIAVFATPPTLPPPASKTQWPLARR